MGSGGMMEKWWPLFPDGCWPRWYAWHCYMDKTQLYVYIYIYADNYCVAYLSGIPTNIAGSITLGLALSPADYWFWWRTNWRSVQSEVMTGPWKNSYSMKLKETAFRRIKFGFKKSTTGFLLDWHFLATISRGTAASYSMRMCCFLNVGRRQLCSGVKFGFKNWKVTTGWTNLFKHEACRNCSWNPSQSGIWIGRTGIDPSSFTLWNRFLFTCTAFLNVGLPSLQIDLRAVSIRKRWDLNCDLGIGIVRMKNWHRIGNLTSSQG